MRVSALCALVVLCASAASGTALGQTAPPEPSPPLEPEPVEPLAGPVAGEPGSQIEEADAIAFRLEQPRTRNARILLASLAGGTVVFGVTGLLFHLDSRSKSDEVSRLGAATGLVWTEKREDTRKAALRSRGVAIGTYAVSGALAIGSVVALILTEPEDKVVTYGVAPTDGGAVVGASWSFR